MRLPPLFAALALLPLTCAGSPPPDTIVHILRPGYDLPQVDADIESVTIEPWGACLLQRQREFSTHAGPGAAIPNTIPWVGHSQYIIVIHDDGIGPYGDHLYKFDDAIHSGELVTSAADQDWTLGPFYDDISGSASLVIQADGRCDRFEGTGVVDLGWSIHSWASFYGATGYTFDFPEGGFRLRPVDVAIRVTYTLK